MSWRHVTVLAAALLLSAAVYCAGVLMPYYATELHRLPLAAVASRAPAPDPDDLWPQHLLVYLAAMSGPLLLPLTASVGAGLGALWLRCGDTPARSRSSRRWPCS